MMKYIQLIVILFIPYIGKAQFLENCYISDSKERICFVDNNRVIINFRYRHLLTPRYGEGTYHIKKNRLTIKLYPVGVKDSSSYIIQRQSKSPSTIVQLNCQLQGEKSCEFVEWGIKAGDQFLNFGEFDKSSRIRIDDIEATSGADIVYVGSLNLNNLEIPIQYGMYIEYSVNLSKRIIYVDEGELHIKIKKKKNILKLVNAKKYIGFKSMKFYPEK